MPIRPIIPSAGALWSSLGLTWPGMPPLSGLSASKPAAIKKIQPVTTISQSASLITDPMTVLSTGTLLFRNLGNWFCFIHHIIFEFFQMERHHGGHHAINITQRQLFNEMGVLMQNLRHRITRAELPDD